MNILFIGDVFGNLGIKAIEQNITKLKKDLNIDLVIANAENVTNCRGLSLSDYKKLCSLGIDYFTMGNHTWRQRDYEQVLSQNNIVRPFNISGNEKIVNVGNGYKIFEFKQRKILLVNIMGSSIMLNHNLNLTILNPFEELDKIIASNKFDICLVDFHAETTSEKNCFFQYFKSRVTAIVGTHTHVQTNDAQIRSKTAFITDIGMTGPSNGVIGADAESLIKMFRGINERFVLSEAKTGTYQFNAVLIKIDDKTHKPLEIKNISILN